MLAGNIRNREDLLRAVRSGSRPKYLFFWGHKPLPNGEIGNSCFSQWWPASFSVNGVRYPSAEHFMMAEKAQLFGDEDAREQILKAASAKAAKQLGRQVKSFKEQVWVEARLELVVAGNLAKFSQNRELENYLLGTKDKVLVEASPVDRIWGIGLAADNEQAMHPEQWRGLNLLGFALMEVRHRLREGKSNEATDNPEPIEQTEAAPPLPMTEAQIRAATIGEPALLNQPILIVEYDPGWPRLFEREAARIQSVLGHRILAIEHVGSTSVPGLAAKPKIDIVLVVANSADESAYVPALETAGYVLKNREPDWYEHRMLKGPDTDVNLHVFSQGCTEIERMLLFRDWLRRNPEDRLLYEQTKRNLARQSWKYMQNYADAKSGVVGEIVARAQKDVKLNQNETINSKV